MPPSFPGEEKRSCEEEEEEEDDDDDEDEDEELKEDCGMSAETGSIECLVLETELGERTRGEESECCAERSEEREKEVTAEEEDRGEAEGNEKGEGEGEGEEPEMTTGTGVGRKEASAALLPCRVTAN